MNALSSLQAVEDTAGVRLYGFDADDNCVLALGPLADEPTGSLRQLMTSVMAGLRWNEGRPGPAEDYAKATDQTGQWAIIAECDAHRYDQHEADMGAVGLRLTGAGYVLGLLHLKPEGNRFEHAGEGSIWQYVYRDPVQAEAVLDEVGLDCEIHAIGRLIAHGCYLEGMCATPDGARSRGSL